MDSRIENLTNQILLAELQSLKASLKLVLDDPSYSAGEAKKMLLSVLLNSSTVSSNTNDYQALTPKGFYNSTMTDSRLGVGRNATNTEITGETSIGLIKAEDLTLVKTNFKTDFFEGDATITNADSLTSMGIISFVANGNYVGMVQYAYIDLAPDIVGENTIESIRLNYIVKIDALTYIGVHNLVRPSSGSVTTLIISGYSFYLNSDGEFRLVKYSTGSGDVKVSITANAILS